MKAIVNLIVQDEAGATPIEFAFLAAGISMVILVGLLWLEG
jgi:Flp pilus assembly pilin Flp